MPIDPLTIGMLAILAVLIFFMFRNSRKRQRDQAELQEKIQPGAEIMTSFGLYGTLVSIDEESNVAVVETSPGNTVRVHRQTIAKVVEAIDATESEVVETDDEALEAGEPEFGERSDDSAPKKTDD